MSCLFPSQARDLFPISSRLLESRRAGLLGAVREGDTPTPAAPDPKWLQLFQGSW